MATQLKNSLSFVGLVVGVPTPIAHGLNWNGRGVVPDIIFLDSGGYIVTADATNITITRTASAVPTVQALCESWHTIERDFGPVSTIALVPQPIVIQGSGNGGGGGGSSGQEFRHTVTAPEALLASFPINFPVAEPDVLFDVRVTLGGVTNQTTFDCPVASYLTTGFTVVPSGLLTLGDVLLIEVRRLT